MTKEEIKDIQENLISLVPSDIRKSKELKKSDKILLGQLIYLYGMDKAKANGYVFRSNDDLENDTKLSSQTIRISINRLIKFGAINRTVGSRAEGASVYTLNFEITPKNHPYMTKDEVEVLIEAVKSQMRAEFQKKINDLHDEIAKLKGVISDKANTKSPLKITPIQSEITPQIQNTDKETTNHSKTIENNDYSSGEGKADEGDVAIFKKIEGKGETSQATVNKADQSIATPQMVQTTNQSEETRQMKDKGANPVSGKPTLTNEERIAQLEALNLQSRTTPNVNPIELAKELGEIIVNDGVVYQSRLYNRVIALGCYLGMYANDIETLNHIEGLHMCGHITKYGTSHPTVVCGFQMIRDELNNSQSLENSPEPHQTQENGQEDSLPTQSKESDQIRPESPRMEMREVECIKVELEVWGRCEYNIHDDDMAESDADNAVNNLTKLISCIQTVAELNWCDYYINRAFEQWGWILGTRYEMYHNNITRQLTAKRKEMSAA